MHCTYIDICFFRNQNSLDKAPNVRVYNIRHTRSKQPFSSFISSPPFSSSYRLSNIYRQGYFYFVYCSPSCFQCFLCPSFEILLQTDKYVYVEGYTLSLTYLVENRRKEIIFTVKNLVISIQLSSITFHPGSYSSLSSKTG